MPQVVLRKDEYDRDKVHVYTRLRLDSGAFRRGRRLLVTTIHVDDIADVFGTDVGEELEDPESLEGFDSLNIEVNAVISE